MNGSLVITLTIASAYITWCTYSLVTGKGSIYITSSQVFPKAAVFISKRKGIKFFYFFTTKLLHKWELIYLFRHIFGVGMLIILLVVFFLRIYFLNLIDFIWLPIALFLTILFHEFGHAISYAKANIFIIQIKIGFPIAGSTSVLSTVNLLGNKDKAWIGLSGSAMNLIIACTAILIFLMLFHVFFLYLFLINCCFFSNSFYTVTKDYQDIISYIS